MTLNQIQEPGTSEAQTLLGHLPVRPCDELFPVLVVLNYPHPPKMISTVNVNHRRTNFEATKPTCNNTSWSASFAPWQLSPNGNRTFNDLKPAHFGGGTKYGKNQLTPLAQHCAKHASLTMSQQVWLSASITGMVDMLIKHHPMGHLSSHYSHYKRWIQQIL